MKHEQEIRAWFSGREEQLKNMVSRLVAVPSVKGQPLPGMPFGSAPAAALSEALSLASELGLQGENLENYVAVVDLNQNPTALHILGHLDVVAAGDGWNTDPYQTVCKEGMLYGRGVSDDKGPMAASLLALQCVKELGIPLKKNVRLIFGADEESGSEDIAWYFARYPHAPGTFSPDAEFPLVNVEKGMYRLAFSRAWPLESQLPRVLRMDGGLRINVVPGTACAVVAGLDQQALQPWLTQAQTDTGAEFAVEQMPDGVQITAKGIQTHASLPETGNNAITALLSLLARLPLAQCPSTAAIHALNACFPHGDVNGTALGIDRADEISGKMTCAFSLLSLGAAGLEGQADCRTPLCADEKSCRRAEQILEEKEFSARGEFTPAHHTPADLPFVSTLLKSYETYTGRQGKCLSMGGGTYVHGIPNGVAFGCCMPGFDSNMHGANEHIPLADLLTAGQIFAQAIVELCSQ